jgi:sugar phosphate permease
VIGICDFGVIKFVTMYLPSLIQSMGHTAATAHYMTAPPCVIAFVFCLLAGYSSSRQKEHGFHLAFCLAVGLLGFILLLALFNQGKTALFVSTCIACCGTFAACPLVLSWLTNNVGGHTKRATAVGFVVCIGQIGGIVAPQVRLSVQYQSQQFFFVRYIVMLISRFIDADI